MNDHGEHFKGGETAMRAHFDERLQALEAEAAVKKERLQAFGDGVVGGGKSGKHSGGGR